MLEQAQPLGEREVSTRSGFIGAQRPYIGLGQPRALWVAIKNVPRQGGDNAGGTHNEKHAPPAKCHHEGRQ
jgi:hypothetical protein